MPTRRYSSRAQHDGPIIIGGKNDRILFIISPTERMSHPDMRSVCIRDILLEAPCYMTDCRLKVS